MNENNDLVYNYTVTIAMVTKEYPSWTEFISWKEEEESSSHSYFVQPIGEKETFNENAGISELPSHACIILTVTFQWLVNMPQKQITIIYRNNTCCPLCLLSRWQKKI